MCRDTWHVNRRQEPLILARTGAWWSQIRISPRAVQHGPRELCKVECLPSNARIAPGSRATAQEGSGPDVRKRSRSWSATLAPPIFCIPIEQGSATKKHPCPRPLLSKLPAPVAVASFLLVSLFRQGLASPRPPATTHVIDRFFR